jgi:hypothetical protein
MQKNSPINTKKHILVHANVLKTINIDLSILEKPLKLPSHFFGLPFCSSRPRPLLPSS